MKIKRGACFMRNQHMMASVSLMIENMASFFKVIVLNIVRVERCVGQFYLSTGFSLCKLQIYDLPVGLYVLVVVLYLII